MKTKIFLILIVLVFSSVSCMVRDGILSSNHTDKQVDGSGYRVTEIRPLPYFHSVHMSTEGKVYVTQGNEQEVAVTVDDNAAKYISTTVRNNKLVIGKISGVQLSQVNLVVNVTMTDLEKLATSSSGDIIGTYTLRGNYVSLITSSSGFIRLDLEAEQLYSSLSSSGDLFVSGSVPLHRSIISSSGDLHAFNLNTDTTEITLSSSGNAQVYAYRLLDVTLSSSGSLYYKGEPNLTHRISSSGRIIKVN
jgi:hypothetical protein